VVPAYTAVDVRWGWRASRRLEVSLNVQNLLDARHVEFGAPAAASQLRRGAWLKLQWRT
jgi:iron complex outermembrane receptor protein